MDLLETVQAAYDYAQSELVAAEIALVEATAGAQEARASASKLKAALAALTDVPPTAEQPKDVEKTQKGDETSEDFDKRRKKRQKQLEKEEIANNPLGHVKCSGCGATGYITESMVTAPSGATIRMTTCGKCNNQTMG